MTREEYDTKISAMEPLTEEQQARAITKACNKAGLDSHITWHKCAADAHTWAERISVRFRDGRQPRPVKNSYMYCDTLDMCFFYGGPQHNIPHMAYAGYVTADSPDITEDKLVEAFKKADVVLQAMKRFVEEA